MQEIKNGIDRTHLKKKRIVPMGKKGKRNYEDMDCLEVNLNVKAVIVYQGFLTQSHFC